MTAPNAQTEQNTLLMLRHPKGVLPLTFGAGGGQAQDIQALADYLSGVAGGNAPGENWVDIARGTTSAVPVHAFGWVLMSTSSGTVGATVNGVALTLAWATSDVITQTAFAALVRASSNALIQGIVGASNLGCTVALAAVAAGDWFELQRIGASPVRFTAVSGAPGVSGVGVANPTFNIDGSNTVDGDNLAAAINATPAFKGRLYAVNAAGTLTIIQLENSTTVKYRVQKSGGTLTLSAAGNFAALATTLLWALQKGKLGNCITLALSGTNVTVSGARFTGGVGGDAVAPVLYRR